MTLLDIQTARAINPGAIVKGRDSRRLYLCLSVPVKGYYSDCGVFKGVILEYAKGRFTPSGKISEDLLVNKVFPVDEEVPLADNIEEYIKNNSIC